MPSLPLSLSLLSLLPLSLSLPQNPPTSPSQQVPIPPKSQEFSLAFTIPYDGSTAPLYVQAVQNGTDPRLVLAGNPSSAPHTATPAYLNGTDGSGGDGALVFDLTAADDSAFALYGARVADLGDAYGAAVPVSAAEGDQGDRDWGVKDGGVYHRLYSGAEGFFACLDTVNGEETLVLTFGVYTEQDQPPEGCVGTTVKVNYDVPGGATGPGA